MAINSLTFRTFEEVPEFVRVCLKEGVPLDKIHQTLKEAGLNTGFIEKAISKASQEAQVEKQLELLRPEATPVGKVSVISVKAHTKSMTIPQPKASAIHLNENREFTGIFQRDSEVELDLAPLKTQREEQNKDIYDPLLQRTVRFEKRAAETVVDPEVPGNILPRKLTVVRTVVPERSSKFLGVTFRGAGRNVLIVAQTGVLFLAAYIAYTFTFDKSATERFTILEAQPANLLRR